MQEGFARDIQHRIFDFVLKVFLGTSGIHWVFKSFIFSLTVKSFIKRAKCFYEFLGKKFCFVS